MDNIDQSFLNSAQKISNKNTLNQKESPSKQLGYTAIGAGASWAISKSVDTFVKSKKGDYKKSLLGKLVEKIDNWSNKNKTLQTINNKTALFKEEILKKHTRLLNKPEYNEITQALKAGAKTKSMLVKEPLIKQLSGQLAENLKKLPVEELNKIGIGETVKNLKTNPEAIKKVCETIKASSLNTGNTATLINKIQMLEHVNKNSSFLSKLLTKTSIGTGNFVGGNLFGIMLMGFFIGSSIKSAMEAPKGERFSTFMEDIMGSWIGGYLLMSPAAKVVNAISGLKNLGMSSKKLTLLGKLTKRLALNKNSKLTQNAINILKNKATQNLPIWQKALKVVGKIVGAGQGKTFLKALPGGIIRFALVLALTAPFVKLFKKISHVLFGKPTPKNEKNTDNPQVQNLFEQARNSVPQINQTQQINDYLPSPTPAVFEKQKNNKIDLILKQTEETERKAMELLKQ